MNGWQRAKNLYHWVQAQWWRLVYAQPDRALKLYGITGTNGKTTTSYILDSILAAHFGRGRVGMLTTVARRVGEEVSENTTKLTTLPSRLVYSALRDMRRAGVQHVVLELSSHALDQHRLAGLALAGGIILNLEREHLDYHRTMAAYAVAKGKLIRYLQRQAPLVLRADVLRRLQGLAVDLTRVTVIPFTPEEAEQVSTPLVGSWNRENALAASLLARARGIAEASIAAGVAEVRQVPGRMEWVVSPGPGRGPRILIDYAVTPGALRQLYRHARAETTGKVYAVLGAAGLRDRGKRAAMARAAAELVDELVLTREDPWTEDEAQIFSDLEGGLRGASVTWQRIVDRREAIRYCLTQATPDDVIVITGKGAERGMAIGNQIVPWNDKEAVLELLEELQRDTKQET